MTDITENTVLSEAEQWQNFVDLFCLAAAFQGRIAYFFMSIHAVSPDLLIYVFGFDPYQYLWVTMVYGIAIMIFARPTFRTMSPITRISFAILGSLMFNHASMDCFEWFSSMYPDRIYMRTFLSFFSGRIMMGHFLAFMYHMDTRTNITGVVVHRDRILEQMYYHRAA